MEEKNTITLSDNWILILEEVIAQCPEMNFQDRAEVIKYCLMKQIPLLQKKFIGETKKR